MRYRAARIHPFPTLAARGRVQGRLLEALRVGMPMRRLLPLLGRRVHRRRPLLLRMRIGILPPSRVSVVIAGVRARSLQKRNPERSSLCSSCLPCAWRLWPSRAADMPSIRRSLLTPAVLNRIGVRPLPRNARYPIRRPPNRLHLRPKARMVLRAARHRVGSRPNPCPSASWRAATRFPAADTSIMPSPFRTTRKTRHCFARKSSSRAAGKTAAWCSPIPRPTT